MERKYVILSVLLLLLVSFLSGRYSAPTRVETKTVEVEKKTKEVEKDTHKETKTVKVKKPDGTTEEIVTVIEDQRNDTKTEKDKAKEDTSVTTYSHRGPLIYALSGVRIGDLSGGLVYGVGVSAPVLGPISVGAWGLNNGTLGVSVGLQF